MPNTGSRPTTAPVLPLYPGLMCLPALLNKLSGSQGILRQPMSTAPYKPIPNNEKVDLARFRVKDPVEWLVDDVVSWMLDVAKRHGIPFEEMNMHKFANLTGQQLIAMSEQNFVDRDPIWGPLIYNELRKNLAEDTSVIDEIMKKYNADEDNATTVSAGPSTSYDIPKTHLAAPTASPIVPQFQSLSQSLNHTLNQTLNHGIQLSPNLSQNLQQTLNHSLATSLAAGLSTGLSPVNLGIVHNGLSPGSPLVGAQLQSKISPLPSDMTSYSTNAVATRSEFEGSEERRSIVDSKIRKCKDGKARKRSQHTKGNKLWEFIRDALKNPITCPSVVRWEDPIEGVFRIVESEKLARLWGERKNNTKMTYEKLSRAMRTYYEKQILVPVPKTGLYPKKLVYKFGPSAHGWDSVKEELL
ncbi:Ets-domain protein [Dictyocaulus viviparus]|uniref:Ets-domain protein n=1 Tax=Dictyocaulus viviparus TaxID=29172 RepID=A0A0D8XLY4_DICVI|nr:Ets-domain protein [Dictyocaulus viviparus]